MFPGPYQRDRAVNPMIEYIKSALQLYIKDFSYDTVFHFLRSGMADISREEIDELENYVIRTGARGYRTYSRLFTRRTEEMQQGSGQEDTERAEETMERLNRIRQQFAWMPWRSCIWLPGKSRRDMSAICTISWNRIRYSKSF